MDMYETLTVLALFALVYSSVAGAIERTWIRAYGKRRQQAT